MSAARRIRRSATAAALVGALALTCVTAVAAAPAAAAKAVGSQQAPRTHLVVIVGAAGDEVYEEVFHNWALQLVTAATGQLGLAPQDVVYLGPDPARDTEHIAARSGREEIEQTLGQLADEAGTDDRVIIVLIGHGTGEGEQSRFNIPGRDLNALEYDALLDRFATQQIGFVNTASASGDFATVLAGPNRVIVTATRDAFQNNQTVFPRFFVEAFSSGESDLDKDGRISLLEAYTYAAREVKRFYEDDGRMLTETCQLEDNGDGEATHEPTGGEVDGSMAALLYVDNPLAAMTEEGAAPADPELVRLYEEQRQLRVRIEELKALKATMDPELYDNELEKLLVELALKDQQIRAKGGGQ